jgi:hypothetical protein
MWLVSSGKTREKSEKTRKGCFINNQKALPPLQTHPLCWGHTSLHLQFSLSEWKRLFFKVIYAGN